MSVKLKTYYELTKPGIIYGNVITAIAGFLFASQRHINFQLLIATVLGVSLVIASGCVFNNYIDRDIDKKMARTKNRALAAGTISTSSALVFASILGAVGFTVLAMQTNIVTVVLGVVAIISYVIAYSILKRRTVHGTLAGSIPGSMSLLAGYCAVSGKVDASAVALFFIMAIWQMPHFYAISIFRRSDYAKAKLPVLSVARGILTTKKQIVVYTILYMFVSSSLGILGHAGYVYMIGMLVLSLRWLQLALAGFSADDDNKWARKFFGFSLIVLTAFSFLISINAWVK